MTLAGNVVVVTGGAAGIGRSIAEAAGAAGAIVVVVDVRGAQEVAAAMSADGIQAHGIATDVSDEDSVGAMVSRVIDTCGRIDVLVNNAGLFTGLTPGPFEDTSVEQWRQIFDVNVLGVFLCCRSVVSAMRSQGGGRIVNIASAAAFKGVPGLAHYAASKGAVIAFSRVLARELGSAGILVNAVAPGFTATEGVEKRASAFASLVGPSVATRALPREETPADIVGAVLFLASAASSFITGQTLVVDGGSYLH